MEKIKHAEGDGGFDLVLWRGGLAYLACSAAGCAATAVGFAVTHVPCPNGVVHQIAVEKLLMWALGVFCAWSAVVLAAVAALLLLALLGWALAGRSLFVIRRSLFLGIALGVVLAPAWLLCFEAFPPPWMWPVFLLLPAGAWLALLPGCPGDPRQGGPTGFRHRDRVIGR